MSLRIGDQSFTAPIDSTTLASDGCLSVNNPICAIFTGICSFFSPKEQKKEPLSFQARRILQAINTREDVDLKKAAFELSIRPLYRALSIALPEKEILVTGLIAKDGLGDLFLSLWVIEELKKAYPDLKIRYIPQTTGMHPNESVIKKRLEECTFCETEFEYRSQSTIKERASSFAFIFDVSQPAFIEYDKEENYQAISEYDAGYGNYRGGGETGLGVGTEGIFLSSKTSSPCVRELENPQMKQLLQDSQTFYFGYIPNNLVDQLTYIYSVISLESSYNRPIDIVMPFTKLDFLDSEYLKKENIGTLTVISQREGVISTKELFSSSEGKHLRLIHLFPFSKNDFQILSQNSHPFTGCTGDQSLAECISYEDILPFHEKVRHKWHYTKAYNTIAKDLLPSDSPFVRYVTALYELGETVSSYQRGQTDSLGKPIFSFENSMDVFTQEIQPQIIETAKTTATLLQDPRTLQEAKEVHAQMKKDLAYNHVPADILTRYLGLQKHPSLAVNEKALWKDFKHNRKSLPEIIQLQRQEIALL